MVLFSGKGRSADEVIERMAYQSQKRDGILVVTSDGMQQKMVFGMGCLYMRAEDFERQVSIVIGEMRQEIERRRKRNA